MTNGTSDFTRVLTRSLHRLLPTTRRARRGLALCSLLVLAPAAFISLPASRTPESACESVKRWATRYAGTSPTLDEIAAFTRAQRVAIFNVVAPAVRATLWQEQLRRFNQQTDLTAEQHALVAEGLALTTPALYEKQPQAVAAHKLFVERARKAFVSKAHLFALADLGSVADGSLVNGTQTSLLDRVVSSFRANAAYGACSCYFGNDPLCPSCMAGGCSPTLSGCGVTGGLPCNGTCP